MADKQTLVDLLIDTPDLVMMQIANGVIDFETADYVFGKCIHKLEEKNRYLLRKIVYVQKVLLDKVPYTNSDRHVIKLKNSISKFEFEEKENERKINSSFGCIGFRS